MLKFVAARRDGLGARLRILLNAMALADLTEGRFEFGWPENDKLPEGHAIEPAQGQEAVPAVAQVPAMGLHLRALFLGGNVAGSLAVERPTPLKSHLQGRC